MFRTQLIAEHRPHATSPLSAEQAFELARSPHAFADSVRSVRSAGLYAFGATSVCFLVGECGAGAICRLCHRCAHVARGRGSRLAPLGHRPCARSMSARAAGQWATVAGSDAQVPAWQDVDADLREWHGLCAARRQARGSRALLWRRRRRRRRDALLWCGARVLEASCCMSVCTYVCRSSAPAVRASQVSRLNIFSIPTLIPP